MSKEKLTCRTIAQSHFKKITRKSCSLKAEYNDMSCGSRILHSTVLFYVYFTVYRIYHLNGILHCITFILYDRIRLVFCYFTAPGSTFEKQILYYSVLYISHFSCKKYKQIRYLRPLTYVLCNVLVLLEFFLLKRSFPFPLLLVGGRLIVGVFSGLAELLPYNIKFSEATTVMIQY